MGTARKIIYQTLPMLIPGPLGITIPIPVLHITIICVKYYVEIRVNFFYVLKLAAGEGTVLVGPRTFSGTYYN